MVPTRNRNATHGTNPTNHHPYANPADQFNMAFRAAAAAAAANQQAQQAPRGYDENHNDGDNGSTNNNSESNTTTNNSNANDPGCRLAEFRENFTPENIRKSSKSTATFAKHQSNHERFLVWLFNNKPDYLLLRSSCSHVTHRPCHVQDCLSLSPANKARARPHSQSMCKHHAHTRITFPIANPVTSPIN
jgi:hypothetical protein